MLNSSESNLLGNIANPAIPERRFNKYEGWYTLMVESVEEQENIEDADHAFTEYNAKCRILNGPSKGVEFLRLSTPPEDHPDYMTKEYGPDNQPLKDADGQPVYALTEDGKTIPNGRWKRQNGLTRDVLVAIFVGDEIKGRGDEAKAKRTALIKRKIEEAGNLIDALTGQKLIVKMRLDKGVRTDKDTGQQIVYSPALKKEPRLKANSFMSFSPEREKKYVLDPKNLTPPKPGQVVAPTPSTDVKVDLSL